MKMPSILLVILLTLIACLALLHEGLPPTHDGEYHVIRFYEFDKAFKGGSLYPRWAPDLNRAYGVPLFNYVYPLPNYVSLIFHAVGISFIDAFKLNMLVASFLGAIFMYFWAKNYWGEWGGVISSVFYTYAPYHFLDIYIRGSVGEVWALSLFPAFLWAATCLIKEKRNIFLSFTSLLLGLIIFSHNILSLMFFPFALSYIVFLLLKEEERKTLSIKMLFSIILGLSFSSIFWLPALFERGYVQGLEVFDYRAHFVELYQLIFPGWGSGFSADQTTEGLSFQIGVSQLVALVIVLPFLFLVKRKKKEESITLFMFIWFFVSIFFMHPISLFLWEKLPLIQYFQFPWRFLSLSILCIAFLAGSIIHYKRSKALFIFLLLFPVALTIGYTKPVYYHMRDDSYYVTRSNFIDGTNSPGDTFNTIWFNKGLAKAREKTTTTSGETIVNTAYFPSWQIFVDGKRVNAMPNKDGLIAIQKVSQNAKVETKFLDTPIQAISKLISLASLLLIFLLLLRMLRVRIAR